MFVADLEIPHSLVQLIDKDIWPQNNSQEIQQNITPIVAQETVHRIFGGEDLICLYSPPFTTIEHDCLTNSQFWIDSLTNVGQIDYAKSVLIADFGLGSDAPIILNYELSEVPRVMYLKWLFETNQSNQIWITCHRSFEEFALDLGLINKYEVQ